MARRSDQVIGPVPDETADGETGATFVEGFQPAAPVDADQTDDDETRPAKGARGELAVMRRMVVALDGLDDDSARHRVLDWLTDYYRPAVSG